MTATSEADPLFGRVLHSALRGRQRRHDAFLPDCTNRDISQEGRVPQSERPRPWEARPSLRT
jgi:hypothetical protein